MARTVLRRLTLRDFRSYSDASLELDGRPVALSGLNGAGKTNLLEAVSYLAPGKGLRGTSVLELGRRMPGEPSGRAWSVSTMVQAADAEARLGTGVETPIAPRRVVRLDGETVAPGRLADVSGWFGLRPPRTACSWRAAASGAASSTGWPSPPSRSTLRSPTPMIARCGSACAF